MFLFVIPLMIFLFAKAPKKDQWILGITLGIITLSWLILRYAIIHSMPNPVDKGVFSTLNNSVVSTGDITSRLATAVYLQFLYIFKLLIPFPLSHDYSYNQIPVITFFSIKLLISIAVLSVTGVCMIICYKKNKLVFFGILYYFLTIATVSNILVYIGATFGERFLFTPSLGFSIVTGALLALLLRDTRKNDPVLSVLRNNKLFTGLLLLILVTYSGISVSRNLDWKDNYTLFSKDVNRSPNSARAHYNYGSELIDKALSEKNSMMKQEMLNGAVSELRKAVSIFPWYIDAYNNLGNAYANLGKKDSAISNYAKTLQIDSAYQKGYYNLGINLFAAGQFREAIPCLVKYAMFRPDTPRIFYYLGSAYGSMGDFDNAIACLERCIAMDGRDLEALLLLGKAYGMKGKLSNSLEIFSKALQVDGNNVDALFNMGLTYNFLNQPGKSIELFQKAIQLKPDFMESYIELAKAYDLSGDKKNAALIRNKISNKKSN
jgi:tetratricopeptide (TPR) repeat protein